MFNHSCLTKAQQQIVVDIARDEKVGQCIIGFGHDMYISGIMTGVAWSCAIAAGAFVVTYYTAKKKGEKNNG